MRRASRWTPVFSGVSAALRLLLRPAWRSFERAARDPETAQRALWAHIAREAEGSSLWRQRWGRGGAPPLADLPVTEYADYGAAFQAAFEEGSSPTSRAPVEYWAESSGTTAAAPKRFPYVAGGAWLRSAAAAPFAAWLYRLALEEPHLAAAPVLLLANAGTHASSPQGVPVGFASKYLLVRPPAWVFRAIAVPRAVYHCRDLWEEWAPLYAVARDMSLATGISAGWHVLFYESLLARMDDYWPYLEGRRTPPPPLPPVDVRRHRLRHLRKVFGRASRPTLSDVWPGLAAVVCFTGASAGAQVPLIEPLLGGASLRDLPYIPTEGPVTIPLYDGAEGNPVHPGGSIVELLPDGAAPVARNLLPCWRAEPGCRYEVFLTTVHGLVRYRLHDLVLCTGWFHRSPRLRFRCKTRFVLKVTTTAIPEDEVARLLRDVGYRGRDDLLLGPHPSGRAFAMYVRQGSDAGRLAEPLERALMDGVPPYHVERDRGVLSPLEAFTVPASHAMWEYRTRAQAKSRVVLREAPRDLPPAMAPDGRARS